MSLGKFTPFNQQRAEMKKRIDPRIAVADPELGYRQTGRTTARAFAYIATAMSRPNQYLDIENHAVGNQPPTRQMNTLMMHKIREILETCQMNSFEFKEHPKKPCWQFQFILTPWSRL